MKKITKSYYKQTLKGDGKIEYRIYYDVRDGLFGEVELYHIYETQAMASDDKTYYRMVDKVYGRTDNSLVFLDLDEAKSNLLKFKIKLEEHLLKSHAWEQSYKTISEKIVEFP